MNFKLPLETEVAHGFVFLWIAIFLGKGRGKFYFTPLFSSLC